MIRLRELVSKALPREVDVAGLPDIAIDSIAHDSRAVKSGSLFVAIPGTKLDGRMFIEESIRKGAVAVVTNPDGIFQGPTPRVCVSDTRRALGRLAAAFYDFPSQKLNCIGVTGTNGKTTSTYLLEHCLTKQGRRVGVLGTVNYRYPGKEWPASQTTPDALRIQQTLVQMVAARCDTAVLEVSSHALDQNRTEGIDFKSAIFTNLTQDHLDYHKTLDAYFECKAKLFTALGPSSVASLNADDAWAMKIPARTSASTRTFGIDGLCDFKAGGVRWERSKTYFELTHRKARISVESPLIGRHNVYNVLGALAALEGAHGNLEDFAKDMGSFAGVPGRLESVQAGQNFLVFVDYAHTDDGLENVLSALRPYAKRLIVAFGCGGERDRGKRPKMAQVVSHFCDTAVVTSDNPRSEDPREIAKEICAGFPENFKNYTVMIDRRKAIRQALLAAREGDIVLLAGKGHETVQVIGREQIPFNDKEEALRVLSGR